MTLTLRNFIIADVQSCLKSIASTSLNFKEFTLSRSSVCHSKLGYLTSKRRNKKASGKIDFLPGEL